MNPEKARVKFGQRIHRCSGCYGAFYLKDMWLGAEATYYCQDCRDDSMFHFDEFSRKLDFSKLPRMESEEEESTQCQNPLTRKQ